MKSWAATVVVVVVLLLLSAFGHRHVQAACGGKIDIILCMDGSGSIGFTDYQTLQKFAKSFVNDFTLDGKALGEDSVKLE